MKLDRTVSIAPMMARTDRHFRYLARLITRHALLYTEMITTGALLRGDTARYLAHDDAEHPLALQLGGCDPGDLARSARLAEAAGFDEVNLNIGCPSDRVQAARFGACLMAEPELVADCVAAMRAAVKLPVTVKTRTGIDRQDSYENLSRFITTVAAASCGTFIIHARKAWLRGLSPKENRDLPPLRYDVVHSLKREFPELEIILNGGVTSLDQAHGELMHVDGVMLGREAYQNPFCLAEVDRRFYGDSAAPRTREQVLSQFIAYVERQLMHGAPLSQIAPHMMGIFHGQMGARQWRGCLSRLVNERRDDIRDIDDARSRMDSMNKVSAEEAMECSSPL
ncbi:MAG: tRNA dihydrouridine(20/20a) synthase DusA [Gammaproteobacteria bacterium]|nr:tRNA dihydrouridine(20/20a) synthase DusA [Gammaproteobacteria bacterium]MBA3731158.1 tRNA dihydrouridine(20/20a) synthase DusA [Gammaproteobacteria bacterium]